jgi:hypothetical protein
MSKSRKPTFRTRKNKTAKKMGGAGTPTAASVRRESQKLQSIMSTPLNPGWTANCTSGTLSSVMPKAITAAKQAITYANDHRENPHARELAEIRIQAADYWTAQCNKRRNWRKETNLTPNHAARDWYEPGPTVLWRLMDVNESARRRMRQQVFPALRERVRDLELEPNDDENAVRGKEYRKAKRRYERRAQGLPSASPSSK